jgi:hypothetical protein
MDWQAFARRLLLADGKITDAKTALLRQAILSDGGIDPKEVDFLIDLKRTAKAVAPSFDRFLLAVMKKLVLMDGVVSDLEARWLEQTLFDGRMLVTDMTIRFLRELKAEADEVGPRFDRLFAKWTAPRAVTRTPPSPSPRTRPRATPGAPPARPRTGTARS